MRIKKFEEFVNEELAQMPVTIDVQDFLKELKTFPQGFHRGYVDPKSYLFDALVKNQNMRLDNLDGITILDASVDSEEKLVLSNYQNQLVALKVDNADQDVLNTIFEEMLDDYNTGNGYIIFFSDPDTLSDIPALKKDEHHLMGMFVWNAWYEKSYAREIWGRDR